MILNEHVEYNEGIKKEATINTENSLLEFFNNQDKALFETMVSLKRLENMLFTESNLEIIQEGLNDYNTYINTFIMSSKKFMSTYNGIFFKNVKTNYFDKIDKILDDNRMYFKNYDDSIRIIKHSFTFGDIPKTKPLTDIIDSYNKKVNTLGSITELDVSEERTKFFAPNNINAIRGRVLGIKKSISDEEWVNAVRKEFRGLTNDTVYLDVTKSNIKEFIDEYSLYRKIYNSMYKDYNDILSLLDSIALFFNKGFKTNSVYLKKMSHSGSTTDIIKIDSDILDRSAVESYFALLFNETNKVYNMIVTVFYEKMMAFIDCIKDYTRCLQHLLPNEVNESMDFEESNYENIVLFEYIQLNRDYYNTVLEQINNESELLKYCYENALIDEERFAVVTEGLKDTLNNFIEKIIEIIDKIKVKYSSTSENLIKSNEKWLNSNKEKLQKFNYDNISAIHIIPYWDVPTNDILNTLKRFENELSNPPKGPELEKIIVDEMVNNPPYKEFTDMGADFKTGLRNKFTMNSKIIKSETLTGAAIKDRIIKEIIPFIENYGNVVNPMKTRLTSLQTLIRNMNRRLPNVNKVEESYSILEETMFINSSLRHCLNFEYVFEAEEPAKKTDQSSEEVNKEKEVRVEAKPNNDKNGEEGSSAPKTDAQQELAWLKETARLNQLAVTTAMSVLEERYRKYVKVCKDIITAGNAGSGETTTDKAKDTAKNVKDKATGTGKKIVDKVKNIGKKKETESN